MLFRSITGIVTDSVTNEPLPYVSVFLKGPQVGVTTDDEGRFSIKTSSAFSKIIFTSLGYRGKEISVKRGGTRTLEVKLVPSTYTVIEVDEQIIKGCLTLQQGIFLS